MAVPMNARQKAILIESLRPAIKTGFDTAIGRVRLLARLSAVEGAITEGSLADVIRALGVSEARYLLDFVEGVREAYRAAGQAYMDKFPARVVGGARYPAIFDINNPKAERFLRDYAAKKLTGEIMADQRKAIRRTLEAGMARGDNPKTIALNLVGRIDRATGQRSGGVVGLTDQFSLSVERARAELLSGDPARMRAYKTRARRDARFDALVDRAIAAGKPVAAADVERVMARYSDRLLQLRGETIARTETQRAVGHAHLRSLEQAVEDGVLQKEQIRRVWRSSGADGQTRDTHLSMDGEGVGLDEPFELPGGAVMFPGDDSLGADPSETINCRCRVEEDIRW